MSLSTGTSTQSKGNAKWNACWRHACYLSKYIYKDPPPTEGFKTQFPDKMAEIEKYWEVWQDKEIQPINDEFGLVARLYRVKGSDRSNKADICPPCLVFRGTDFDDFRGIAAFAPITVKKGVWWTFNEAPITKDKTIPSDATRESLITQGYTEPISFSETGTITLQGAPGGATIDVTITLSLHVLTDKAGDWTSNIQQGRGLPSEQYSKAKEYGTEIVNKKIINSSDKRLEITGHSLGGGLASATAAALDKKFPDVITHATVFNAAGVHPNTIHPAGISDGMIDLFSLDDEILTTLSNRINKIPFLGAFFQLAERQIGQLGLPETLGSEYVASPVIGSGDGLVKTKENKQGKYKFEKWSKLPNLFPINEQTLLPMPHAEGFPVTTGLDNATKSGSDVSQIGNAIVQFMVSYFGPRVNLPPAPNRNRFDPRRISDSFERTWNYYKQLIDLMKAEITPELAALADIMSASVDYHGMDFVIATFETKFSSQSQNPSFSELDKIEGVPLDPKNTPPTGTNTTSQG